MKIKNVILTIVVSSTFYNCKPQEPKIDLNKDVLGKQISEVQKNKAKFADSDFIPNYNYGGKQIYLQNIFGFDGLNFSGSVKEEKKLGKNKVNFIYSKADSVVSMFQLSVYQTDKTKLLENHLNELLGEPSFTGFSLSDGKLDTLNYSHKVWEDQKNNRTYFFEVKRNTVIYQTEVETASVTVIDNSEEFLIDWYASAGFAYWGDFLDYRKRFKTSEYTYKEFLNEPRAASDYHKQTTQ
ncbi:hypothetical protein [uncultured Marixanthomonas sp.]|uniref:hypothetical protein n=1 Tax=uncultured Marixanthomonas sp. TaxID=757245 RepID=UPI0030D8C899|tara:strand:+ start:1952 stop:2668 length:717 start_codon:yes stop_codon:yes gene_type:complete